MLFCQLDLNGFVTFVSFYFSFEFFFSKENRASWQRVLDTAVCDGDGGACYRLDSCFLALL